MIKMSGHHKALEKAKRDGVLKRGQDADVTVTHRHGCVSSFKPWCDCSPRVQIKTRDNGTDEPTMVYVKHVLSDGRTITTEKDGVGSVVAYDKDGNETVFQKAI